MKNILICLINFVYKVTKKFFCSSRDSQFQALFPSSQNKITLKDHLLIYLIPSRSLYIKTLIKHFKNLKETEIVIAPASYFPFKCSRRIIQLSIETNANEINRRPWIEAAKKISSIDNVNLVYVPLFLLDHLEFSKFDKVWIPHRNRSDLNIKNGIYYMQMVFPFFFTISRSGWGMEFKFDEYSSRYVKDNNFSSIHEIGSYIKKRKLTKIKQLKDNINPTSKSYDFIYFTQLPHDYNILNNSSFSPLDVMNFLHNFSIKNSLNFLVKIHPLHKNWINYYKDYISHVEMTVNGHIHDYFSQTENIVLINSGVGAEALFFSKNIIIFGNTDYDSAVTKSKLSYDSFDKALKTKQKQFLNEGFLNKYFIENNIILPPS